MITPTTNGHSPLDQTHTILPKWLPVAEIEPNSFQYRRSFPEFELQEMEDSIRAHGLLQAIVVRPIGERRLRAVKMLEWSHIPATARKRF
jgi:ParB family chromosome partitioning protein